MTQIYFAIEMNDIKVLKESIFTTLWTVLIILFPPFENMAVTVRV